MGNSLTTRIALLMVCFAPTVGFACSTFNDDFEAYVDQTALDEDWPDLFGLTGVLLVTGDATAHSGSQYLHLPPTNSRREWGYCLEEIPTDATPYVMEFWMRCRGTVQGNNYCEALRWEGDPFAYVSMVVQFGDFNATPSVGYTGRIWILNGNGPGNNFDTGWFEVGGNKAPRVPNTWQHLRVAMRTRIYEFSVDGKHFETVILPIDSPMFTHFYVGADGTGSSSHDVDDLRFEPVPLAVSNAENWGNYR